MKSLYGVIWSVATGLHCARGEQTINWGPLQLSTSNAPENVKRIHDLIQSIYYSGIGLGVPRSASGAPGPVSKLSSEDFESTWSEVALGLEELAAIAPAVPALSFPVGAELYHWFFFRWQGAVMLPVMDDRALESACRLLELSAESDPVCSQAQGEGAEPTTPESVMAFLQKGCDYRWTHLVMLEAELGRELALRRDARAAGLLAQAGKHLGRMLRQPFFAGRRWTSPYDMNMNEEMFPSPGPVWPREAMPLVGWLEENFGTFRGELDAVRAHAGLFDRLVSLERNAEGQDHARQEDWEIIELADTREEEPWKEQTCAFMPGTCELLRGRPEFHCDHAGVFVNRMRPGAWIKPHMGNPPRLVAHLALDIPPEPIDLYVGNASLRWETGKAHVIDDTYIHSVRHHGIPAPRPQDTPAERERFILHMLICHPCEQSQKQVYANSGVACS